MTTGRVFDIQRWSLHDGPGVRTLVFLKGCPLRCSWCCNPESQEPYPELAFFPDKCINCHQCVGLCPHGALTVNADGRVDTDWSVCAAECYGKGLDAYPCTARCYSQARKTIGTPMTVDEVLAEVMKDASLYEESGGGISVSGGEPMNQAGFVRELLRESKQRWLHTAMETCGFAPWSAYESVLPFVDFLFLDIKHIDSERHAEITGQGNELILENAPRLAAFMAAKGGRMVVRIPVVPELTDEPENIRRIAQFVREALPTVTSLELMPYHRLGRGKYRDIGREYTLAELAPPTNESMQPLRDAVAATGLALSY